MKDKPHDPRRLDVRRFAAAAGRLEGTLAPADLPRLVSDAPLAGDRPVHWVLTGEERATAGAPRQPWLRVQAEGEVALACQRCLQPMTVAVAADRSIRFVADEAEAERLDELSEDDVLALPAHGGLDALALVEDELILALPLVPRHATCPQPLPLAAGAAALPPDAAETERPHPFAALAVLKGRRAGPGEGGAGSGGGAGQGGAGA